MAVKKIVVGLAALVLTLVVGFSAFVWWQLQPRIDLQPLPADLIANDSVEGKNLLASADATADYPALAASFEQQSLRSFCGVASSVAVLNAMGANITQSSFFNDNTDEVRSRLRVTLGGMALPDVAGLLNAHGANATLYHADASTAEEFRAALVRNLANDDDFMLVNYQREVLGQGRVGHISPLAAYDDETDRVLVLDTAGYKYPPTWVPVELLFSAMSTIDSATGKTRGFVEVAPGINP